ncbi:MAG TPA: DUF1579 family protein [Acidobacteriota bacterium]|jgi:hypothetical protein|nr:DUF1579 family protein [Acidobacteriota bacterium]HQP75374.1 DUF1579 family protein [Acidobacteriota bacterium]
MPEAQTAFSQAIAEDPGDAESYRQRSICRQCVAGHSSKLPPSSAETAGAGPAQAPGPQPGPEYKALEVWVGSWELVGEQKAGPLGPAIRYAGKPTWQMTLGGFLLEGRFGSGGAGGGMQGMQILTFDAASKNYPFTMCFSDRTFSHGTVTVSGKTWSWKGTLIAGGKEYQMRGTDVLSADRMSDTYVEGISTDGTTWLPLLEEKLTRLLSAPK